MSIDYQFGDVDAHGALIRAQAASLGAEHHRAWFRSHMSAGLRKGAQPRRAARFTAETTARSDAVVIDDAIPTPQTTLSPIFAST